MAGHAGARLGLALAAAAWLAPAACPEWCAAGPRPALPRCTAPVVRFGVPANSLAAADGLLGGGAGQQQLALRAGEPATVNVTTRDNFREPYSNASFIVCAGFLTASLDDPSPYAAARTAASYSVRDWEDGNFTVTWLPTHTGRYHIVLRLVGAEDGRVADCAAAAQLAAGATFAPSSTPGLLPRTLVAGQPYWAVTVGAGPTVNESATVGGGNFFTQKAVAGVPTTFVLTAADRFGNRQTADIDESSLWEVEVESAIAEFEGEWETVEGQRVYQGTRVWTMMGLGALLMDGSSHGSAETSVEAVPGEPGLYLVSFTTPHIEVCIEPIDDKDPNAPLVCPLVTETIAVPVSVEVLWLDGNSTHGTTWSIPQSPFAGSVQLVPPATYQPWVGEVSRPDSDVGGVAVKTAGDNVTTEVALRNQWSDMVSWRMAYGALLATIELAPLDPSDVVDDYPAGMIMQRSPSGHPGEYIGVFSPTVAGVYTVRVTLGRFPSEVPGELGENIPVGEPFPVTVDAAETTTAELIFETFSPTDPSVSTCRSVLGVAGSPCGITAGEEADLQLVARDRYGNLRKHRPSVGYDQFEVNLHLASRIPAGYLREGSDIPPGFDFNIEPIEAVVSSAGGAQYQAVTRLTISGEYFVELRLHDSLGVHTIASGEDFGLRVRPAEFVPGRCWAGGPGTTQAVVGQTAAVEVRLFDSFGNFATPNPSAVPHVAVTTNGSLPLGALMTSPESRPGTGDPSGRVGCAPTSCEDRLCFCHFPFTYYGEEYNSCVETSSGASYCGTKRGRFDPGTGFVGGEDYRCGIMSSAANGFSTRSIDYCIPTDEIAARWRETTYSYEVYYLPEAGGTLPLRFAIPQEDGELVLCDDAAVDVRFGGRLLITEVQYNPPDVPVDDRSVDDYADYAWKLDGTALEYIELYNDGNAAVNLRGLAFTSGVEFTFPDYVLQAGSYTVVPKDPMHETWDDLECFVSASPTRSAMSLL